MASFRKSGKKWRAEVEKNKRRASKTFDTKAEAREWAAEKELEFANTSKFVSTRKRVSDLFERYAKEVSPKKKGHQWEIVRIKMFQRLDMSNYLVGDISTEDILIWKNNRLNEVAPGTVKREMNLLSSMFAIAVKEWKWLKINPVSDVSRPKSPAPRDRRITENEIKLICDHFGFDGKTCETKHQQIAVMFLLAIETAMRLGEMHGLTADRINIEKRYLSLSDTKNNDARDVPLSNEAIRLIKIALPDLFTVSKDSVSSLFSRAVRKLGIDNLVFHDTRHEAITRLARKLDVLDLARMVGQRDLKSLMIYYNATASEIADRLK